LPVLQTEFATSIVIISTSISAVILGITLSNLPFGALADRVPIQSIIFGGVCGITLYGLIYEHCGWNSLILFCFSLLSLPLLAGFSEK
jgi:MFS family permease